MKRVILDTNIYGKLVEDKEMMNKVANGIANHEFIIYDASIIKKELRATPKKAIQEFKKLRILLLNIYDSFITKDNQNLQFNKLVEALSNDYFSEYKKNKGGLSDESIKNDLIIVATATIYQLDIIISDDERSMLSEKAVRSYKIINNKYGLKDPIFKMYSKFKKELTR